MGVNGIELYSTKNKRKSSIAKKSFLRNLKNLYYRYMNGLARNVYIDNVDKTVSNCNENVHSNMKVKHQNLTPDTYIEYICGVNKTSLKFKPRYQIRISINKNTSAKFNIPDWAETVFVGKE